jgi:hypothetical protein
MGSYMEIFEARVLGERRYLHQSIFGHMQKIIQIYPCLQKLSRKQDTILKISDFSTKIEQFWPFEEISIFSNGGHLGYRTALF